MSEITMYETKIISYPEIIVEKPDRYLSRLILVEYAGCESELSSISKYLYQSLQIKEKNWEISQIFEQIAISEITHFKILGKIIEKLGEKPIINLKGLTDKRIENRKKVPYKKIISENIINETESIRKYKKLITQIKNRTIKEIIEMIIEDERDHVRILETLYKNIS